MNEQQEEFSRRMEKSYLKEVMIQKAFEFCKGKENAKVLDLGCGNGFMSQRLAKMGIDCTCVDLDFLEYPQEETEHYHPIKGDMLKVIPQLMWNGKLDYDVIILSAVLHEINHDTALSFVQALASASSKPTRIIIGEHLIMPSTEMLDEELNCYFDKKFRENYKLRTSLKEYWLAPKICEKEFLNQEIAVRRLNWAFCYAYGKESWEREKSQMRFTFSWGDITNALAEVGISKRQITYFLYKDPYYKEIFANVGLGELYDFLAYTSSCLYFDYDPKNDIIK